MRESASRFALCLGGERRLVVEPEIAAAFELRSLLALGAAHLVDSIVDQLDGVEFVEGDLGFGEVVADALDEGATHVDAHLLDVASIAIVGFEIVGEGCNGICITAVGNEQDAALVDIDEQRDVVVTALGGGLVDGDALDVGVVGSLAGLLDPVVDDTPQPGVVLLHKAAAALTGIAVMSVMTSASNSSVKPEPARAHGTAICLTPQSGQVMRGVRACRNA